MIPVLDNIVWHSLAGNHFRFSAGVEDARRYLTGFSPILGFADQERPNLPALNRYCDPGEQFYTDGWSGTPPLGWGIVMESTMWKMIRQLDSLVEDEAFDPRPLGANDAAQALQLAELTHPGPFGVRTIELGEYFGYFDGPRLIAMAGERFCAGNLHEISGVCTHPDYQGQGLARKLMTKLIHREINRGETSVLHVMSDNVRARQLYRRLGFRDYRESVVRVIQRC